MLQTTSRLGLPRNSNRIIINARPQCIYVPLSKRFYANDWVGAREKGLEDQVVRKHEEELLKKLREAESAKIKAENRAKLAEEKVQKNMESAKPASSNTSPDNANKYVTLKEFNEFRKEIIARIQALEK